MSAIVVMTATLLAGCAHKVLRHNGAVNMTGDMTVRGAMDMGEVNGSISLRGDNRSSPLKPVTVSGAPNSPHTIAIIDVDDYLVDRSLGGLGSSGENPVALFREKLELIRQDPNVRGVVVRVNSPGGGVTASDMMCHELTRLTADRDLPVVACVMTIGAGGGYYLANHCDAIVSHPTSIVGGVGVILNVYNLEDTMGQFNVLSTPIKSGDKIDAGTPERPIDQSEMDMLQGIADSFHTRFIEQIIARRPGLADQKDKWTDGNVMTGEDAKTIGLVDAVGYLDDAIEFVRQQANLSTGDRVVMYRRENDQAFTALDVAPGNSAFPSLVPIHIPGLDRSKMPTFLYMWQADPAMAARVQP